MSSAVYQEVILDHARSPRRWGRPPDASGIRELSAVNELCGDAITLYVGQAPSGALAVGFESQGCALCKASASMLATLATGKSPAAARALATRFTTEFPTDAPPAPDAPQEIVALYDMRRYPARRKCVLLAWDAFLAQDMRP